MTSGTPDPSAGLVTFVRDGEVVGRTDFCEPQLNLLAHAQAIELLIGSRCGGHGICGGDRVRIAGVLPGQLSRITEKEMQHLTETELNSGLRLACQCYPNESSLELRVELCY